jgi:predicted O-methyltransferase YrrM
VTDALHTAPGTDLSGVGRLMEIADGLWAAQTLGAAECLDLFTFLDDRGAADAAETAEGLGLPVRPAEMLLTACAALGLLVRGGDGRYANAPVAARHLVRGRPEFFGDYIRMLREFAYPGWSRIVEAIRTDRPVRWEADPDEHIFAADRRPAFFWDGLYALSSMTARVLDREVDLGGARSLLDVGGGAGAFDVELCRRRPDLRATVFDLPHVCEIARLRIAEAGLEDRIGVHPGDFFADELPRGHDTILLSMILHDWDEAKNRELLARCHRALPSGGTILISELLVDDDRTGPLNAALMSMNMLIGTFGRNYTAHEYHRWLRDAGFTDVRTIRFAAPGANGVVLATRP